MWGKEKGEHMNNNRNYLCSIDELNFKDYLDDALTNCGLFVAAASGKVGDVNPIKKLYTIYCIISNSFFKSNPNLIYLPMENMYFRTKVIESNGIHSLYINKKI